MPVLAQKFEPEIIALYEEVVKNSVNIPGKLNDAEIFEKVTHWSFSDFKLSVAQFVGITEDDLKLWQLKHRINLSSGVIKPQHIDLKRGYAWGYTRLAANVNRLHSTEGPPSEQEVLEMGF